MKLLLLHGPAINSSRAKLTSIKKGFDPLDVVVYEEGSDIQTISGSLITVPLLSDNRLVVLENPPEDFVDYSLTPIPYTLIFWFDHEVSEKKPVMEWVKNKGQVFYFEEAKEVSVFPFLDSLGNRNKGAFLELDKLKQAGYDNQYLISMIFYLLRNLVSVPKNAKEFVKKKNARMRANFTSEQLVNLYKSVLETDFKIKSGLIESEQAEFLLVNLFLH